MGDAHPTLPVSVKKNRQLILKMLIHPARTVPIATLIKNLSAEIAQKTIYRVSKGALDLYCYTNRCVYNQLWNPTTILARGLIINRQIPQVVATPFPKFFNYEESAQSLPELSFTVTDKLDGSLIIVFFAEGQWQTATKGAFLSSQAQRAQLLLKQLPTDLLCINYTYLFELISPDYQIVIHYPHEQLILLSVYNDLGRELEYSELKTTAQKLTVPLIPQRFYPNLKSLWQETRQLDLSQEGFVVRWQNGVRIKLKGQEYRRVHQILSGITPLGVWKLLKEGKDLETIRQSIPEEFWQDWDDIVNLLNEQLEQLLNEVENYHQKYLDYSDKALGLILNQLPDLPRKFLFARRKQGTDWHRTAKCRTPLLNFIRPES